MNDELDWDRVRVFLAVVETGSLTGAAARLRTSQPTVGRQIAALEEALGVPLIRRHSRGVVLTDQGEALREAARRIAEGVEAFARQARGVREEPVGTVRISTTEAIGVYVLPAVLGAIREALPRVELEVVLDNRAVDLLRGEADLAVRMFRPRQQELVGRRVGEVESGLYASAEYVARRGAPEGLEELLGHTLIGFDRAELFWRAFAAVDARLTPERFALRSDAMAVQVEAVRQGFGIGIVQTGIAARLGGLVRVCRAVALPQLEMWVVTHADLKAGAHIGATFDLLVEGLGVYLGRDSAQEAAR